MNNAVQYKHMIAHVHLVSVEQHQAVKVNVQTTSNLVIFVVINVSSILVLSVTLNASVHFSFFLWIQYFS